MGWESINLSEVDLDTTPKPVPSGTYTLQLMGASDSKFNPGGINITTTIVDEGSEFRGRTIFIDIPNPDIQTWAPQVLARMIKAMGASMPTYGNPVEELNRLSQNGHSRFQADVYVDTYLAKDGVTQKSRNKVVYKSFRPAA